MCEAIGEVRIQCLECDKHKTNDNPDGCPGSMGECVRGELVLTKEEAAALLCVLTNCSYCEEEANCQLSKMTTDLLYTIRRKLKAYIGR